MGALAEMFCRHGPAYRANFGDRRQPSHRRAMQYMAPCRPETLGGQVSHGATCQEDQYRSHSCQNRPGPQCQQDQAAPWLGDQQRLLRPVLHVLVTLTLPAALSALARRHQQTCDNLLVRSSSEA